MTTNNPNRGLATNQQGCLPTDDRSVRDLPPGANTEGVKDNGREKKPGLSRPPFPASFGRMMLGRPPPVYNLKAPAERPIAAADAAVTCGTMDQITTEAKADTGVAEQGRDRAGTDGSPNATDYNPPAPIPCPFCWATDFTREMFCEVDLFVLYINPPHPPNRPESPNQGVLRDREGD